MAQPNLMGRGIFTIPVAAGLVDVPTRLMRVWVEGHKGRQSPVIENELGKVAGKTAISFTNLMELQFVAFFSKAGVRLQDIRAIMSEAKNILEKPHPFATRTVFQTDGKKIVAAIAAKNGVESIYDLRSNNYEMKMVVLPSLMNDIVYDPAGNAQEWFPRRELAPNVIINPLHSFGRTILRDSRIPTSAIADAFGVEKSTGVVASMFEISERRVKEAVSFEASFRLAA